MLLNRIFAHFMKLIVRLLIAVVFFSSCTGKFGKIMKSTDNEYKYKMAEKFYAEKKWSHAQELYDNLMSYMRGTPRYENMYYKYAYTAYYQKDYMNAEQLFKTFSDNFPTSQYLEEVYYNRAYCFYMQSPRVELDQTPTQKAMATFQEFVNSYPNSTRTKQANDIVNACKAKLEKKEFLGCQLYYNLGYYKAAYTTFELLMDDYPDSDHTDEYLLKSIQSMYEYSKMSLPMHQTERYNKVVSECDDFLSRFKNSNFATSVTDYKNLAVTALNKIKNEQNQKTN